jgi:hypothetical protein
VIYIPKASTPLSVFHFSFYLYHILKEPIPFEIQCKIIQHAEQIKFQHNIDCSSSLFDNNKRDYSYTLFRSLSIYVARQIPLIEYQQEINSHQSKLIIRRKKIIIYFLSFRIYYFNCYRPLYRVLSSCLFSSHIIHYLE